ncbi:hypothetical protein DL769_001393 [Monosporascus sp. CRB-8-3]|nr:hypothetical protein DL769_001393 [Monosporascus sp. CRB-8-3]
MAQGFQHTPLKLHRGIRVVDLLPSRKRDAPLQCKTREVRLGDREVRYEALSYVWGARTGDCPIVCNGQELLVTPNCHDALVQLRRSFRIRTLWIDAICIDQRDSGTSERNEQVMLMGSIYHNATRVIVWLGLSNKEATRVFRYISLAALVPSTSHVGKERMIDFIVLFLDYFLARYFDGEDPWYAAYKLLTQYHDPAYDIMFSKEGDLQEFFVLWFDVMLYPNCRQVAPELVCSGLDTSMDGSAEAVFKFLCSGAASIPKTIADKVLWIQERINCLANYALFILDSGYLGLAYHNCQAGDRVVLLAGLDCPVLLRPEGDAFRIVAPAHIHGAMHGEMWPEDESELQQITLV